MRKLGRYLSRLHIFGLVFLGLLTALIASQILRRLVMPSEIRYLPKESSLVIATGDIKSLWWGVDAHFGDLLSGEEGVPRGKITEGLTDLRDHMKNAPMPVTSLADLERYGIDTRKGALLAVVGQPWAHPRNEGRTTDQSPPKGPQFVAVLHVLEGNRNYLPFLESLIGAHLSSQPEPAQRGNKVPIFAFENGVFLAHPESGILLLSRSKELLLAALLDSKRNYSYLINNDRLYSGIRDALGRRLLRGAGIFFWARQPHPLLKDVSGAVLFMQDRIELKAICDLRDGQLSMLRQFLDPPPRSAPWEGFLPSSTAAAVSFDDPASSRYLNFFGYFARTSAFMKNEYGGLLLKLGQVPGLKQVLVAATGYRSGVPNVVLGLWGDTARLEEAFSQLQAEFRLERDRALLNNAIESAATPEQKQSISALVASGYLVPEENSLFERFRIVDGRPQGNLEAGDFDNSSYSIQVEGKKVRFLLPPVTDNDIRYKPELQKLDAGALKDNRYRMPFTTIGEAVWVCTDLSDLKALLGRTPGESLLTNLRFREARPSTLPLKLDLFINIDQIIDLGLLSPESRVTNWVKANLFDLRNHPAVSLVGIPSGEHRLLVSLRLMKRD